MYLSNLKFKWKMYSQKTFGVSQIYNATALLAAEQSFNYYSRYGYERTHSSCIFFFVLEYGN